jgi:hypothetical protein
MRSLYYFEPRPCARDETTNPEWLTIIHGSAAAVRLGVRSDRPYTSTSNLKGTVSGGKTVTQKVCVIIALAVSMGRR